MVILYACGPGLMWFHGKRGRCPQAACTQYPIRAQGPGMAIMEGCRSPLQSAFLFAAAKPGNGMKVICMHGASDG